MAIPLRWWLGLTAAGLTRHYSSYWPMLVLQRMHIR